MLSLVCNKQKEKCQECDFSFLVTCDEFVGCPAQLSQLSKLVTKTFLNLNLSHGTSVAK